MVEQRAIFVVGLPLKNVPLDSASVSPGAFMRDFAPPAMEQIVQEIAFHQVPVV